MRKNIISVNDLTKKFSDCFFKWAKPGLFLFIFVLFSHCKDKNIKKLTTNDKIVGGVLGSQNQGSRMEGKDESAELWRHP